MITYQLTIPTENAPGRLARVSGILAEEKINIRSITISSFGDKGFFNILVDDPKLALKVLEGHGITAKLSEVIAVMIKDKPGGMDRLVQLLASNNVNIEHAYGFVIESNKDAVFVIDVDNCDETQKILKEHGFKTLNADALIAAEPFHYMRY
ncbi:MAG: ACT domain-containing protein [Thermodesulfobacteriota bacterium]|nr:ACT domain-containing protein [Thermodesulfobacteriota bacterium]